MQRPGSADYTPGAIETVRDLNGDGRAEAVITEGSSACFGAAETGYSIVSKQADQSWKLITAGTGMVTFLDTKGADGWPDIEIGPKAFASRYSAGTAQPMSCSATNMKERRAGHRVTRPLD